MRRLYSVFSASVATKNNFLLELYKIVQRSAREELHNREGSSRLCPRREKATQQV
jgi:hypothetical protein